MRSHGIIFHYFENEYQHKKCQGSLTANELSQIILYLRNKYQLMDACDYFDCALKNSLKDDYVCLTFDDGVKSQIDVAWDVLRAEKVTGFFFTYSSHFDSRPSMLEVYHDFRFCKYENIDDFYNDFTKRMLEISDHLSNDVRSAISSFDPKTYLVHSKCHTDSDRLFRYLRDHVLSSTEYDDIMMYLMEKKDYNIQNRINDLWMSKADLKYLHSQGNIIGLHSHTHPTNMAEKSKNEQYNEYFKNKQLIQQIINGDVSAVSYPSGSFNCDTNEIMRQLNIKIGFRVNMNVCTKSILHLPRKNHTDLIDEMKEMMWMK